ncbi:metallophosphoesterase [Lachnospiraceae bacterium 54-53]
MTILKKKVAAAIITSLVLLPGSTGQTNSERTDGGQNKKALSIVFASDLHYLSPAMTDYGEHFMEIIRRADGKMTHYTPEIIQAFVAQVLEASPDYVVLSGDLTLNGDEQSHKDLAALLELLNEAGIGVYVLPGNHDVDGTAYRFSGDDVLPIEGTSSQDFVQIYESLGYIQALSKDDASLSYTAKLTEDLWLLMLDVNANREKGFIPQQTLSWVKEQLQQAHESGAAIIGVSHQNLLAHSSLFQYGFQILGADDLLTLYKEYGVNLHFSGHMHLQHIMQTEGVTDIATSCMAVTPNQYGVLEIASNNSMSYKTIPVDVPAWAVKNEKSDENLLHFSEYAADFFDQTTEQQVLAVLESNNIGREDTEQLRDFAVEVNRRYFAGTLTELPGNGAGLSLWQEKLPDEFFTRYFKSMTDQPLQDMTRRTWDKQED